MVGDEGSGYIISCVTSSLTLHTYTCLREQLSTLTMENKRSSTELAGTPMTKRLKPRKRLDFDKISDNVMNIGEKSLHHDSLSPIMTRSVYEELLRGANESPTLQIPPEECDEMLKHFNFYQQPTPESLAALCQEIGIENTENKENTNLIDIAESTEDLHLIPMEVNAFELPLNFSQTKRLKLAVDLRTQRVSAMIRGEASSYQDTLPYLRLSIHELFALMKTEVFDRISNLFLSQDKTEPIQVGKDGLEIFIHKIRNSQNPRHFKKNNTTLIIQRKRSIGKTPKIFFQQSTWFRFGELRDRIKITHDTLYESLKYVTYFVGQFVREAVHHLKQRNITHQSLTTAHYTTVNSSIKEAFDSTSPVIEDIYSQEKAMTKSCNFSHLREDFKVFHFMYLKELVLEALKASEK